MGMSSFYENLIEKQDEKIKELEATIEGLGQQNTELERDVHSLKREKEGMERAYASRVDLLEAEIEQHKTRYQSAVRMIENRQKELDREKGARVRLAQTYTALRQGLDKLLSSVEDLKNVNTNDLDDAIDELVSALAKLLNP